MNNTILYYTGGATALLFLWLWGAYNGFIKARNQVKTDFADVDVQLKRRASLIENLAAVVKEYAKHEEDTFKGVAEARSALNNAQGPKDSAKAEGMFSQTLRSLFAVSESYPKLRASENFQKLQDDLKETEDQIAQYREVYNQTVLKYNTKIQTFPNLLAAGLFGFPEEELFEVQNPDSTEVNLKTA